MPDHTAIPTGNTYDKYGSTNPIEQRLMREEGISTVSTWIGSGVPRFYLPINQIFPQSNVSQLIVVPQDLKVREAFRQRLPTLMAQEFPEVRARITVLANGPPVAYPVCQCLMAWQMIVCASR